MEKEKPKVVLATGPLNLFWTTGLYYLWELSKQFSVVLIVDMSYQSDPSFQKLRSSLHICDTLYVPSTLRNPFKRHRFYWESFTEIMKKHGPVFVLQHNAPYVDNIYLFNAAKLSSAGCCCIVYQTSRMSMYLDKDYEARTAFGIQMATQQYGVPPWLAKYLYHSRNRISYYLNYYVMPLMITGRPLKPHYNIYTGKLKCTGEELRDRIRKRYDYTLTYYQPETGKMQEARGYEGDFIRIRHPAEVVGDEVHRVFYPVGNRPVIAVMPTYGYTSRLLIDKGLDEKQVELDISQKWVEALTILLAKFPKEYGVAWKLHPHAAADQLWKRITSRVNERIEGMQVLSPQTRAEELIVTSAVVVTDVSTVFWFANLLPKKIVISLDIFGYDGGDEARYYEGVLYFDSMADLASASFNHPPRGGRDDLPTLTDTLNDILSVTEHSG
ncbi:MAG: polysialyltransferase family glycosyltransferase [Syntrophales bacterium]